MAHPSKSSAARAHADKLSRMTAEYGAADAKANKAAPIDSMNVNGPQEDVGFGADSATAKPRGDRPARRSVTANPVATYRKGGRVKHRDDGGSVSAIEAANKDQAAANRARGGRTKHKGTHVNVVVMPQSGNQAPPNPVVNPMTGGPNVPPHPPMAPPGPPPGAGAGPGLPPPMMGAPGATPPGMAPPRARGGRLNGTTERTLKNEGLTAFEKGDAAKLKGNAATIKMDDGSLSGEGRLEKSAARARNARKERPQAV